MFNKTKFSIHTFVILIIEVLVLSSCTTLPELTKEELALQGVSVNTIKEIINLINLGKMRPKEIEITQGIPDPPFYYAFSAHNMAAQKLKFSDVEIGKANNGNLRNEDPKMTFPLKDDSVETYSFTTPFDVWQFTGVEGQKIDLMVRSLSTFPVGMFMPYFILINDTGNIVARQAHILTIPKEPIKSVSIMIWIKDFIIPKAGSYYLIVLADNYKRESLTWDPEVRINNDRIPLKTSFKNEGWEMYTPGGYTDNKENTVIFTDPNFQFGHGGGEPEGVYEIILWSSSI